MIAFDSSALAKLVIAEAETAALHAWLADRHSVAWTASALCGVEVVRAVARSSPAAVPAARVLLSGLDLVPVSQTVLDAAAVVGPPGLRGLDAVHLVTALSLGTALEAFVVYDDRLAGAARAAGLPVATPA